MIGDNHERDAQQRALADAPGDDTTTPAAPTVDQYRLIYRLVREADMPELPVDFATQMEHLTRDHAEPARLVSVETWLVRAVLAGIAFAALGLALPALVAVRDVLGHSHGLPWPMLLATCVALLGVGLIDRARDWKHTPARP